PEPLLRTCLDALALVAVTPVPLALALGRVALHEVEGASAQQAERHANRRRRGALLLLVLDRGDGLRQLRPLLLVQHRLRPHDGGAVIVADNGAIGAHVLPEQGAADQYGLHCGRRPPGAPRLRVRQPSRALACCRADASDVLGRGYALLVQPVGDGREARLLDEASDHLDQCRAVLGVEFQSEARVALHRSAPERDKATRPPAGLPHGLPGSLVAGLDGVQLGLCHHGQDLGDGLAPRLREVESLLAGDEALTVRLAPLDDVREVADRPRDAVDLQDDDVVELILLVVEPVPQGRTHPRRDGRRHVDVDRKVDQLHFLRVGPLADAGPLRFLAGLVLVAYRQTDHAKRPGLLAHPCPSPLQGRPPWPPGGKPTDRGPYCSRTVPRSPTRRWRR